MTCYARKELQTAKNESTLIALADFLVTQVLPTRRNLPTLCKLARENKAKHPLTGWGGDSSTRMQGCLTSQSPEKNRIHLLGGEADAVLTCITGTPELKRVRASCSRKQFGACGAGGGVRGQRDRLLVATRLVTPLGSTGSREASQDEVRCCHARRKEAAPLSTILANRGPTQFHTVRGGGTRLRRAECSS